MLFDNISWGGALKLILKSLIYQTSTYIVDLWVNIFFCCWILDEFAGVGPLLVVQSSLLIMHAYWSVHCGCYACEPWGDSLLQWGTDYRPVPNCLRIILGIMGALRGRRELFQPNRASGLSRSLGHKGQLI